MRYLFDTNTCIALINDTSPPLLARLPPAPARRDRCALSRGLRALLRRVQEAAGRTSTWPSSTAWRSKSVPFDAADARAAGAIRRDLEARGLPIGPYDVLIAGQARARDLVLVTANTREFERVDGLKFEDWSTLLPDR